MTNVKKHTRKGKNKATVVRQHTRKDKDCAKCGHKKYGEGCEFSKKFSKSRMERVDKAYEDAGVTPPEGKGIHKVAFHERAAKIMESMKKSGKPVNRNMAYAIAMKQLGKKKSVLKDHRK